MTLFEKLFKVQGLSVKKDAENPFFHSKYITLDNIITVLDPILKDNKLLVFHKTVEKEVVTVLQDVESDDKIESAFPLPEINDPQKLGSAITYAKRYNLGQIFNIVTDVDDDGNSASKQADDAVRTFNNAPVAQSTPAPQYAQSGVDKGWMEEIDFEELKGTLVKGDAYPQVKALRDSGWKISKATAGLITDYINQL